MWSDIVCGRTLCVVGQVDVLPVGGRLVLFKSREVLHEVRPCYAERGRYALSCWLLQDPMKSPALDFLNKK